MDRDQWLRIKQLIIDAGELSGPARDRFLASRCHDAEERRIVQEQLDLAVPTQFMNAPVLGDLKGGVNLKPGDRFDRYQIVRLLGQGGMGTVYQARDLELNRMVALKIIRPDLAGQAAILQRFKQELLLAQKVTHPNVVRIFDLGVSGEVRFITMEYIEGRELAQILAERRKLPPKEAVSIAVQVCRGLAAAHEAGIVHRDLKPANVMIDQHGRARIMDFGIAHSMETAIEEQSTLIGSGNVPSHNGERIPSAPSPHATQAGTFIGTPSFMSPEQAMRKRVDHRSDIFALGLFLYMLITGENPQHGSSMEDLLEKRAKQPVQPLRQIDSSIHPGLERIVMRCLELSPDKRFQTISDTAQALEQWQTSQNTGAAKTRGNPQVKRAAGAAAVFVLLAAGLALFRQQTQKPVAAPANVKVLVSDFINSTGNALLDGALEPTVGICLEGASFITVFDRIEAHRLAARLASSQVLDLNVSRILAQREGIGILIAGTIKKEGDRFVLSVQALDAATQKPVASRSSQPSSLENLPLIVSGVAAEIRNRLGDATPLSAQTLAAETFTSRSLEASQEYARAQAFLWQGNLESALAAYRKSVEKDNDFGRAYAGMATALANTGRRQEADEMYRMALSKIDRMSDREKYRTRGAYYLFNRDYARAIEQFQALSSRYPADTAAIGNLALSYFYQRNLTAAVKEGGRAVDSHPNNVLVLNNLGLYEMYSGEFDKAMGHCSRVTQLAPTYAKAFLGLGLSQAAKGNTADAMATFEKLRAVDARGRSMAALATADLACYEGRYPDAVSILEPALKQDLAENQKSRAAVKLIALADAQLAQGKSGQAMESAGKALELSSEDQTLFAAAMIYLKGGNETKARSLAAVLADRLGPEPEVLAKLIQGELQIRHKDPREAIRILQSARSTADTWLGRFALGRAYLDAGAFPQADAELDACLARKGEAVAVFLDDEPTLRYLPPVHYYLGRAKQGLSSPGAVDHFRDFLKIRDNGQPDQLVKDSKARLAALSAAPAQR